MFLVVDGVDRGPASVLAALSAVSPKLQTSKQQQQLPTAAGTQCEDMSPEEEALRAFSRREVRQALDEISIALGHVLTVDVVVKGPTTSGATEDDNHAGGGSSNRYYRSMSDTMSNSAASRLSLEELMDKTKSLFSKLELKVL